MVPPDSEEKGLSHVIIFKTTEILCFKEFPGGAESRFEEWQ